MDPQIETYSQTEKSQNSFSKILKQPRYKLFLLTGVAVLLLIIFAVKSMSGTTAVRGDTASQVSLEDAREKQEVNKTFSFPLRDEKGKEVSKIRYTVEGAELRNDIVVKGQRATSVAGRIFLIVNLKITNDFDQPVQINVKDYIRLTRNDEDEKLAADVHNDPVEVQAISTKYTRVGFPINEDDKNLVLHIGEINGDKQTIPLTFSK